LTRHCVSNRVAGKDAVKEAHDGITERKIALVTGSAKGIGKAGRYRPGQTGREPGAGRYGRQYLKTTGEAIRVMGVQVERTGDVQRAEDREHVRRSNEALRAAGHPE